MSVQPLVESSPSAEGVAAEGIEAFLDAAGETAGVELHSLVILRHGRSISSGWWSPYEPTGLHLLYSLSKSFTSTALGVSAAAGLLSLNDTVLSYFPELEDEITDARSRSMRLSHLAAMSSGHREDTWDQVTAAAPDNPVRAFLQLPPSEDPGSVFAYNQSCPYTLATILQRVTGTTLTDYLRETVLDAIGAGEVAWTQQPDGQDQGFSGLHATTDTIARLGELYLRDGQWLGRRVLPEGWVEQATQVHSRTDTVEDRAVGEKPDWKLGYGYQFWRSTHGYRADGAFGQFCLVVPELDAVIATTGQNADTQALLDLVWSKLLPAFADAPLAPSRADRRLAERMAGLSLAPSGGDPNPPSDAARWEGAVFSPADGSCAEVSALKRVVLALSATGWDVGLDEGDAQLSVPIGNRWMAARLDHETVPVLGSGGWRTDGSLHLELIFVETPHRLLIDCSLGSLAFTANWVVAPRRPSSLRAMRAPSPLR